MLIYGRGSNKSITAYKLVFSLKIDSLLNMIYVRMDCRKNDLSTRSMVLSQCGLKCKEQNFGRCSRLKISLKMCELDSFSEPSRQTETRSQTFTWFITTLTSSSTPRVMWLLPHVCIIYNPECFPAVTLSSVRVWYWSLSLCCISSRPHFTNKNLLCLWLHHLPACNESSNNVMLGVISSLHVSWCLKVGSGLCYIMQPPKRMTLVSDI